MRQPASAACLASVAWADEIVVVDAESKDDTVDICREFTDHIYVRPCQDSAARSNSLSISAAMNGCSVSMPTNGFDRNWRRRFKRWWGSPAMSAAIVSPGVPIFSIAGLGTAAGIRAIRYDYLEKSSTRVSDARVHEGFLISGSLGVLKGDLDHFSHGTLTESLDKMNRYSSLEALDRLERKRVRPIDFIIHPLAAFNRKYFCSVRF